MTHVMVDLETLDVTPSASILSIGAVLFTQNECTIDTFYQVVDIQSCIDSGFSISGNTLKFWMKQDEQAKKIFNVNGKHIFNVLSNFNQWLNTFKDVKLWGNGSDFDNAILTYALDKFKIKPAWKFYNNRCYRTVTKGLLKRKQIGTHHNALDDAISQAKHLIEVNPFAIK